MRIIALVLLLSLVCRVVFGRWPWEYLDATPSREQRLAAARRLLDVSPCADSAAIQAAWRRKAAAIHPDRGGDTARLQELNAARDLLIVNAADAGAE